MGISVNDVSPTKITSITPPGKDNYYKFAKVSASGTDIVLAMLGASSSLLGIKVFGKSAGTAGDTIVFTVTKDGATISTGTFALDTDGLAGGEVTMTNLPNLQTVPQGSDITITATSTVTSGGPWVIGFEYIQ